MPANYTQTTPAPTQTEQFNAQYQQEREDCRNRIQNGERRTTALINEYNTIRPNQYDEIDTYNSRGYYTGTFRRENKQVSKRMREIESELYSIQAQTKQDEYTIRMNTVMR